MGYTLQRSPARKSLSPRACIVRFRDPWRRLGSADCQADPGRRETSRGSRRRRDV